jgi:hypothetical protein
MSWDIFVQNLPADARTVAEIPDDFRPAPLMARSALLEQIKEAVPEVDFTDTSRGRIEGPGYSIEVQVGDADPVTSFVFHVRGGDLAAGVVADVLDRLGLRAIDPGSDSGFFSRDTATASLAAWRGYRDRTFGQVRP